jgi:uncharacterized protein
VRKIELEFTGGEPLANVDFLDATCEYGLRRAAEEGVEASLSLVTNLTLVGVRQLEFLQKYPIQINASLDGDEEDHNSQRPFAAGRGSYRAVLKNVGKLRDVGLKLHAIQTTVTTRTVDKLPQIAERLLELGFTQLSLHRMNMGGIANPAAAALIPEPERYVDKLFETFETQYLPFWRRHGIMPHARHLGLAYAYLLEPKRAYMCQRSPCGAGRTIIAVKPNGDVHGCAIAPWDGIFHYGNINRQSFEECRQSPGASASAERSSSKIPGCSTCLYRGWCQSGCPRDAFAKHGTIMAPSSSCKFYKELWQRSLFSLVDERYPETAIRALARSYLS